MLRGLSICGRDKISRLDTWRGMLCDFMTGRSVSVYFMNCRGGIMQSGGITCRLDKIGSLMGGFMACYDCMRSRLLQYLRHLCGVHIFLTRRITLVVRQIGMGCLKACTVIKYMHCRVLICNLY